MAVKSEFMATLSTHLNLEHPWLPPTSWDSLPSESGGALPFPPPLPLRPPSSSSVSEASMVRLAMNALQGVQSALISIEKISSVFCSDPADRTFHQIPTLWSRCSSTRAQGRILKSLARSGFLVFLLRRFVDYFSDSNTDDRILGVGKCGDPRDGGEEEKPPPYSLVNRAFAVAVGKVVEGYVCALDTLFASVRLRHSSGSAELPLEMCSSAGCLTTVFHSGATLLELYLHTKELRTQIDALGSLCNLCTIALGFSESSFDDLIAKSMIGFRCFLRGGELLSYLYTQLQVADSPHQAVLKFLFLRSCEPYCGFIRSWIYKAEINDPFKEFVVEHNDYSPFSVHGKADLCSEFPMGSTRVRDGVALPCFLRDCLVPIVRAGQQLQVLMKLLEFCTYVTSEDLTYEDFLPSWNGVLSDHSSNIFPFTFEKEEIEARTRNRHSYYETMQETLETLLTKLEFSYQQVISHGSIPNGFGYGWNQSSSSVFFKWDNLLTPPYTEEKGADDDAHSESMVDDLDEPSECSSSINSEEGIFDDQPNDLSSPVVGLEQRYLSALSFSTSPRCTNLQEKPKDHERLQNVENDSDGTQQSTLLRQISMPTETQESNLSVNSLWKSSVDVNVGYLEDSRSNLVGSSPAVTKLGALKEGISYYTKMIIRNNTIPEELSIEDRQGNNFLTLKDLMVTSDDNILSRNPMLTKNIFLEQHTDHGDKNGTRGLSLPYFDFSSVEDPCTGIWESYSVDSTDSSSSPPRLNSGVCEQNNNQDIFPTREKIDDVNSLPQPKDYEHGNVVAPVVSGGCRWETLLATSSNSIVNGAGGWKGSSQTKFDMPLDFIIDKCLHQEIMLQYKYVSKLTMKLLEEGFDFKEHLLALRRYHFMELADWADLFIISLSNNKWCVTEAEQRLAHIQGFLEVSIQRSSCEFDCNKDRLYVYIKGNDTRPRKTSATGLYSLDFLGLGYRVDWPVSIVLTAGALNVYSEIFSFLIKMKLAIFSLTDVWSSLKELRPLISKNQLVEQRVKELRQFNLLMNIRHQVNHFVSTLQQYVESQLSHVSWSRFLQSLQHKVKDMMDLESVHRAYLTDSLHICFLSDETQHIARVIDDILQCALDFRSCLRGHMWDVGTNQGDLAGLSRINVSQVFSIKKTFDKNLQELHHYNLKSPKHSSYGLSRFWGYLNYNEYYSDLSSVMKGLSL